MVRRSKQNFRPFRTLHLLAEIRVLHIFLTDDLFSGIRLDGLNSNHISILRIRRQSPRLLRLPHIGVILITILFDDGCNFRVILSYYEVYRVAAIDAQQLFFPADPLYTPQVTHVQIQNVKSLVVIFKLRQKVTVEVLSRVQEDFACIFSPLLAQLLSYYLAELSSQTQSLAAAPPSLQGLCQQPTRPLSEPPQINDCIQLAYFPSEVSADMCEVKWIGEAEQKLTVKSMHLHIGQFVTGECLVIEFGGVSAEN